MRKHVLPGLVLLVATLAWGANVAVAGGAHCKSAKNVSASVCEEQGSTSATMHTVGGGSCHAEGAHCGNVVKTNAQGQEVAICGCGMEFTVKENNPAVEYEGKKYFLCSESCAEKVNADPAAMIPVIEKNLAEIRTAQHISGNVYAVDTEGNNVALCACGVEMKVTDASVKREFNGEAYYFCCEGCAANFDKDPAAQVKNITDKVCGKRHTETKQI
jgi:YHS domain-containing protein